MVNSRIPVVEDLPSIELADGARKLLSLVSDKWTILIMSQLCHGPKRFNALRRSIGGITQKALTQALRKLERNGLVERRVYTGSPPAVEYRGTELGFSLGPAMRMLIGWSVEHLPAVEQAQEAYDAQMSRAEE